MPIKQPLAAILLSVVTFGCSNQSQDMAVDPAVLTQHRTRFMLAEEPSDPVGVIALRAQLEPEEKVAREPEEPGGEPFTEAPLTEPRDVVVVGRIGGTKPAGGASDFPWEKGKAAFFIVDPSFEPDEHHHGEEHECKFCQQEATQAQAVVQFVGDDGQSLEIDARQLFDVREDELVVVKGKAAVEVGTLIVTADGIYVRR